MVVQRDRVHSESANTVTGFGFIHMLARPTAAHVFDHRQIFCRTLCGGGGGDHGLIVGWLRRETDLDVVHIVLALVFLQILAESSRRGRDGR